MGATIVRQWLVLAMLPRPPRRIDTATIESRLRDRGIDVHRRTIQRDLLELAEVFPIVADERAKPYGWRWSDDAKELTDQVPSPRGPLRETFALRLLRERYGLTTNRIARAMSVEQRVVTTLEQKESLDDEVVSTLRRYAAAMGGELEVAITFGDHRFPLTIVSADSKEDT